MCIIYLIIFMSVITFFYLPHLSFSSPQINLFVFSFLFKSKCVFSQNDAYWWLLGFIQVTQKDLKVLTVITPTKTFSPITSYSRVTGMSLVIHYKPIRTYRPGWLYYGKDFISGWLVSHLMVGTPYEHGAKSTSTREGWKGVLVLNTITWNQLSSIPFQSISQY